jgi:hypothetical protein
VIIEHECLLSTDLSFWGCSNGYTTQEPIIPEYRITYRAVANHVYSHDSTSISSTLKIAASFTKSMRCEFSAS